MALLEIQNVTVSYPDSSVPAVKDVSFTISKGQIQVLFGRSGSGKTTLLKAVAGLLKVDKGDIILEGEPIKGPDKKLVAGHEDIKLAFQDFHLKHKMTVFENIRYELLAYTKDYRESRTNYLLELCNLIQQKDQDVSQLSGGQQQRLALARALANEPKVILMDEPFSNVDTITKGIIFQEIKSIVSETNTAIVFVTHDPKDALSFGDKIMVMSNGQIVQQGAPDMIYSRPINMEIATLFGPLNRINNKYYRLEAFQITSNGKADIETEVKDIIYFGAYQVLQTIEGYQVYDMHKAF